MLTIRLHEWETKLLSDFNQVIDGEISVLELRDELLSIYENHLINDSEPPFKIFYINSNSLAIKASYLVGNLKGNKVRLIIQPKIESLTLGKILYLISLSSIRKGTSKNDSTIITNLNNEYLIKTPEYLAVTLMEKTDKILQSGLIYGRVKTQKIGKKLRGRLNLTRQLSNDPSFDNYYYEESKMTADIIINQVIKLGLLLCLKESPGWLKQQLNSRIARLADISNIEATSIINFPDVQDYTTINRPDYNQALMISNMIINGYDPFEGSEDRFFPEFLINMNELFENYTNEGLKSIFKRGYTVKKKFTLGLCSNPKSPITSSDDYLKNKFIELDGFYEMDGHSIVIDTKNKYKSIIDSPVKGYLGDNADIYQQVYYAIRTKSKSVLLVYPSGKHNSKPIASYTFPVSSNKAEDIILYSWGLNISGSPKQNQTALVSLARFIEKLV